MNIRNRRPRLRAATAVAAMTTALLASVALSACGGDAAATPETPAGEPITVEHAQGTLELPGVPQRVYSLDWGVTSVLVALGVEVAGVPNNVVPDHLAFLVNDPDVLDVGTLHDPDFETIAANPADLVIAASRSAVHFDELSRIAPTIDLTVAANDNVAQSKATALLLGRIFDREAEAQALVERFEETVSEIQTLAADAGDALIILTSGGNVAAFGPGGRFGFLHDDFGLDTAAMVTEDGRHGQAISFEFLLESDPDWLFVIDRDTAIGQADGAASQVLDNDIVRLTNAYQNDRIVYVNTTNWYIAGTGIVSMQAVADEVLAVLTAGHAGLGG